MQTEAAHAEPSTAIQSNLAAIFVSLELSRSVWLITSLSPGSGEKMSKHSVRAGDVAGLLARFSELKQKAFARTRKSFPIVVIQEAGLDGFWLHRALEQEGVESHVVDPASIATSRRRRRAKTDRIDGEALLRALLAYKRGEPRVCTMVRAPTPEEEDRRRLCRERKVLSMRRASWWRALMRGPQNARHALMTDPVALRCISAAMALSDLPCVWFILRKLLSFLKRPDKRPQYRPHEQRWSN